MDENDKNGAHDTSALLQCLSNYIYFCRLASYLTCGTIVIGGEVDKDDRYIAPTVMTDVDVGSAVMREEIFGPILPIVNVQSVNEAVAFINARCFGKLDNQFSCATEKKLMIFLNIEKDSLFFSNEQ